MLESEGLKIMNMQRSAKIREDLCYIVQKEDFSQTAVDSVRLITQTETNMTDALNLKKKMRHIDSSLIRTDLFYSKQLFELKPIPETIVAVCNCSEDFKYFLEKVTEPCYNDFTCYKEIIVLTNFWCTKTFNKYKNVLLDLSTGGDIRIGFFLVTDFGA